MYVVMHNHTHTHIYIYIYAHTHMLIISTSGSEHGRGSHARLRRDIGDSVVTTLMMFHGSRATALNELQRCAEIQCTRALVAPSHPVPELFSFLTF